jgi:heterodisulfide reductase subunit A
MCVPVCPYQAIEREQIKDRSGNVIKELAKINPGLCQGCGTCVALCRSKSIELHGFSNNQMMAELVGMLNN